MLSTKDIIIKAMTSEISLKTKNGTNSRHILANFSDQMK